MLDAIRNPESPGGRVLSKVIAVLIVLTMIAVVVETLPDLPAKLQNLLRWFEYFVVAVFSMEYVLRIIAAERPLRYVLSFFGIVDLLAVLPFYVGLTIDLRGLRGFRLIRLFSILKLTRYGNAAERLAQAFRSVRSEILVFLFLALIVIYMCGVFVFYAEHDAQPDKFRSAIDGFWWAIATLTTVGYGDIYPITASGRALTVVMLIVGLGVVAVPTGLVASALTKNNKP